jgi:TolB-like protein
VSLFEELKRRNVFRVSVAYIVASWVLLQVADLVLEAIKAPDWVIQAMLMFVVLGFIAAVIIAWAYEMTPEGIKREADVERDTSITHQTAAKLDRITIALLVVVVVIMLAERFVLAPPETVPPQQEQVAKSAPQSAQSVPRNTAAENSIAVLPFVAMSSGQDDEYFADGLTEEILNALAQLPELLITARTSAFHFKGQDIPVTEIAEKLGVQHIVEGSVRRSGERLRVTAQLVRAADGFHVWSQNYDSTSADTIQVQEDIAEQIAIAMDVVMDEGKRESMRRAGLRDVEAFIAMQKARELYQDAHGFEDQIAALRKANEMYERVLELVPGYPPALEEHSDLFVHILNNDAAKIPMENVTDEEVAQAMEQMMEDVSLALQNARNFEEQNEYEINLAFVSGNWRGIGTRIQRYIESSGCTDPTWIPNFAAPFGFAQAYAGRIEQVTECDPMSASKWFTESRAHLWAGNADEALRTARQGMEITSGGWLPYALNWALLAKGEFEELESAINTHLELEQDRLIARINRYAAMGDREAVESMRVDIDSNPEIGGFAKQLISSHTGDLQEANRIAASWDQHIHGSQALLLQVYWCMCGAPWDLDVTPNFAERIEASGLPWPPPSPINWPLKTW